MSHILELINRSQFESKLSSINIQDDNQMEEGDFIFENLKIIQKRNKLNDLQVKLSELASFNQIEFILLLNQKLHRNNQIKQNQFEQLEEQIIEKCVVSDEQRKLNEQARIIFNKSTAREFDFILNKKMQSNAIMLHESRNAGYKVDDRTELNSQTGEKQFKQFVVSKETGKYQNSKNLKGFQNLDRKDSNREKSKDQKKSLYYDDHSGKQFEEKKQSQYQKDIDQQKNKKYSREVKEQEKFGQKEDRKIYQERPKNDNSKEFKQFGQKKEIQKNQEKQNDNNQFKQFGVGKANADKNIKDSGKDDNNKKQFKQFGSKNK